MNNNTNVSIRRQSRRFRTAICLFTPLALGLSGFAQDDEEDEQVFELSPFTVDGSDDQGYRATSTLAGTRIRTDLKDVGSSVSVVTEAFMDDIGATDSESLLTYTVGTETGGLQGNYSGLDANLNDSESLLRPNENTRVRGLAEAENTRDFFISEVPWDGYNVVRVDLQRGPNSILFGLGSPGGVINTNLKKASVENENEVSIRVDEHGSLRTVADFNKVLIEDQLFARYIYLNDQTEFQQDPTFQDDERHYFTARYLPDFLQGESWTTKLEVTYETGEVVANRPRVTPPIDRITPWFNELGQATFDFFDGGPGQNDYLGDLFGGTTISFDGVTPISHVLPVSGDVVNLLPGQNDRARLPSAIDPTLADPRGGGSGRPLQIASTSGIASNLGLQFSNDYRDAVLQDTRLFNFYDNSIDGDSSRQFRDFEVNSVRLEQSLFNGLLNYELAHSEENYSDLNDSFLGGGAALGIDVNETLVTDLLNPLVGGIRPQSNANVGRAMLTQRSTFTSNARNSEQRNTRFTVSSELDFNEILDSDGPLPGILGKHNFTGLYAESTSDRESIGYASYALTGEYTSALVNETGGALGSAIDPAREIRLTSYISGDLRGSSLSDGLNLSAPASSLVVPNRVSTAVFDTDSAQYIGRNFGVDGVRRGITNDLIRSATVARSQTDSEAIVWQGRWLDGILSTTVGLRSDENTAWNNSSQRDPFSPDYGINGRDANGDPIVPVTVSGGSESYSAVLHSPQWLKEKLPGGMNISLLYNESENFDPEAGRIDVLGRALAPPSATTEEMGFMVNGFDDRFSLKVVWYESEATFASDNLGLSLWYLGHAESRNYVRYKNSEAGLLTDGAQGWVYQPINGQTAAEALAEQQAAVAAAAPAFNDDFDAVAAAWGWVPTDDKWQNVVWPPGGTDLNNAGLTATSDTFSEGVELEMFIRPTDNWDIVINAAKTDAVRTNVGGSLVEWIESRNEFWNGPAGDLRRWGAGSNQTARDEWNIEIYRAWQLARLQAGASVAELRPYRANVISNYRFSDGKFKGMNIGGGLRWEDTNIIGFPPIATPDGDSFDLTSPYEASAETNFDFWAGYQTALNDNVDWRIQLNVKNVFGKDELIEISRNPDGTTAGARIAPNRLIQITNTFTF